MQETRHFHIRATEGLATDIAALTGGIFEQWGYRLLRYLAPDTAWDHRGTTITGAPVGYTVDSAGDHARTVAQFSSAANYFESRKPIDDLNGTLTKHPHVTTIWLIAAVRAEPSARTQCDTEIAAWAANHPGVKIHLYDGRNLATFIYDHLDSDELVNDLSPELPTLLGLAETQAFSNSLPALGPYIPREDVTRKATEILRNHRHVALSGLSGIGKSLLAVSLAHALPAQSRIWIDATSLSRAEDLRSLKSLRRGVYHNVPFLLHERECVVVLDNLPILWDANTVNELVGDKSFLIITTQTGGEREDVCIVGHADEITSKSIIELGANSMCPDDIFEVLWHASKGHPLLLRLLGQLARESGNDWSVAVACCDTIVSDGEDDYNEKVCRRILKQHLPTMERELAFFAWCNSPYVDTDLLNYCVSPLAIRNLSKRHFLSAATSRTARLHDIVFSSACAIAAPDELSTRSLREKLNQFIVVESEKHELILERFARRHTELLVREKQKDFSYEVLYALARSRGEVDVDTAFGELTEVAKKIKADSAPSRISVRAVVEAIEATYSLTSEKRTRDAAQERLRRLMPAFDDLAQSRISPSLLRDVRHHRAKMLSRLREFAAAEAEFRELLAENPEFHAAKLQLIRMLTHRRRDEAMGLALQLVDAGTASRTTITIRIAGWAEIAQMDSEMAAARVPQIINDLQQVGEGDIAVAYGLIANIASKLAYKQPDAALRLFELIQDNEPVFSSKRERLDWARATVAGAKALRDKGRSGESASALRKARSIYESVPLLEMTQFQATQFAECLLLLDDASATEAVLNSVNLEQRNEFWWHRYAQAQLQLGKVDAALIAIDKALALLAEDVYEAAFRETRFDALEKSGAANAEDELILAISLAEGKYRAQLQRKLDERRLGH